MAILLNASSAQDSANDLSSGVSDWLFKLEVHKLFRTCVTCVHLKDDRFCEVFNANPPASIIIQGCDSHLHAETIPF